MAAKQSDSLMNKPHGGDNAWINSLKILTAYSLPMASI